MFSPFRSLAMTAALLLCAGSAAADTLLIQRVKQEPSNVPTRGMHSAQVEARFGAPSEKLDAAGGQKKAWPAIQRWVYPNFTVYFQQGRVIDAVANKVGDAEIGPKPASH